MDRDTFVRLYLRNGDESDYLRTPFTEAWKSRLEFVDALVDRMSSRANERSVPVSVSFVPFAPSAVLAGSPGVEPDLDPFAFDRTVEAIASNHGSQYIDILRPMSRVAEPTDMYYSVNGHPNAAGYAVVASAVVSELRKNATFSSCGT
jgi:hypothetical protein